MGLFARLPLLASILVVGCGGSEFALGGDGGPGPTDGASPFDGATTDGTTPIDASGLSDAAPIRNDGGKIQDAGDHGGSDGGSGESDASPIDSGIGDAGPASDGGFACPSTDPTVVFCSDFDKTTAPPWDWAGAPTTPNGTVAVDTTNYISPPNGFAASNTAFLGTTGTEALAYVEKPFSSLAGRIDYSFRAYVKTYDTLDNPPVPIAQLVIGPTTTAQLAIQLVLKKGELELAQITSSSDGGAISAGPITSGQWGEVELLLDRRATDWTITISINGTPKLVAQSITTPSDQNLEVDLGLLGVLPPSTANEVTFDNVTVRAY